MSKRLLTIVGMWLATQHGVYNIVQFDADRYEIRARCPLELEQLLDCAELRVTIEYAEHDDRGYWILVDLDELFEVMVQLAAAVDYRIFTGSARSSAALTHCGGAQAASCSIHADCVRRFIDANADVALWNALQGPNPNN